MKILNYKSLELHNLSYNLSLTKNNSLNHFEYKLSVNSSILSSLDYNKILARGYAMLKDQNDNYISTIFEVKSSEYIIANLKDGKVRLTK